MIAAVLAALLIGPSATRFTLVNQGGDWWLEGPDRKPFFSLGVCCVTTGETYLEDDPSNPAYAAYRYYSTGRQAWADDTVARLQSWNFNTIGAWSDAKTLRAVSAPGLKFTPILHMGSAAGAPWRDMWDPQIVKLMDDVAHDQIKDFKGEGRVIGYFSDNEQGWWYGALFDWAWKGVHTRAKFIDLLSKRYGSWQALLHDFVPVGASDFATLRKSGRLFLRPGGHGISAVDAYIGLLAERYYSLCRSIIKKYDPGALYLGDRYISNFYPAVARAAGKYADVVSTNLNADWNDGTFSPFYLSSLHRISGKPLMITEYYMCAKDNRTGNKNESSGFPVVDTQLERAQGFLNSTKTLLDTPYVVGAHWFQYFDEPKNGRGDGEDYNMGLVNVYNQPYEDLTQAASGLNLHDRPKGPAPNAPMIPPLGSLPPLDIGVWPRDEAYWQPAAPSDRGDAFMAWTPDALYLAVYWNEDRFAEALYSGGRVPEGEEPQLVLNGLGWQGRIRFVEKHPVVTGPVNLASLKMGVRNTAIIRIPAKSLGARLLAAGTKVHLNCQLITRSSAYSIRWTEAKELSN